jgi:hypothetical protein
MHHSNLITTRSLSCFSFIYPDCILHVACTNQQYKPVDTHSRENDSLHEWTVYCIARDWLLINAKWAIFLVRSWRDQVTFWWYDDLYKTDTLIWNISVRPQKWTERHVATLMQIHHLHSEPIKSLVLRVRGTIVFGLTRQKIIVRFDSESIDRSREGGRVSVRERERERERERFLILTLYAD